MAAGIISVKAEIMPYIPSASNPINFAIKRVSTNFTIREVPLIFIKINDRPKPELNNM